MKKIIGLLLFSTLLSTQIFAKKSCEVKCRFSECKIESDRSAVACGCYFGIASCKDGRIIVENDELTERTIIINDSRISMFVSYLDGTGDAELLAVKYVVAQFTSGISNELYDQYLEEYKLAIGSLDAAKQASISTWIEDTFAD